MKGIFIFITALIMPFITLKAAYLEFAPLETKKTRERVLSLKGGHILYLFTDNTIVYLHQPPCEKQTWYEWWNNFEHAQPDPKFYFRLKKWNNSTSFQLYSYEWKEGLPLHCLEPLFKKSATTSSHYPYFIENLETGEMTLCRILSLKDLGSFIMEYGEQCYDAGYKDGYSAGDRASSCSCKN